MNHLFCAEVMEVIRPNVYRRPVKHTFLIKAKSEEEAKKKFNKMAEEETKCGEPIMGARDEAIFTYVEFENDITEI